MSHIIIGDDLSTLSIDPFHAEQFYVLHSSLSFIQLTRMIPIISMYIQAA